MTRQQTITDTDLAVQRAIDDHWRSYCVPPTVRQLCQICAIPSTNHVTYILRKLQNYGRITLINRKPVPVWVVSRLTSAPKETTA